MKITPGEKKQGSSQPKQIGIWKGELKYINPTAAQLQKLYEMDELPEEPAYQGEKDGKSWAILNFIFEEEISKRPVPYRIFLSKEVAEFEVDGKTRSWYINQLGESQLVYDRADLFRSFTHLQRWNKDEKKMEDVLNEAGQPVELSWRKAYKGETALYSLLKKLVTQDWFQATEETSLFIKIDELMRGKVSEISSYIGTENFQPVVGCIEIAAKDGENGINYYQNCVDQAWMGGWKMREVNAICASNGWSTYEDKVKSKGKTREIYQFYHAVKRNKNITELVPIHEFNPDKHVQAGNATIAHSETTVEDTDW